jgi:hypothetical protein
VFFASTCSLYWRLVAPLLRPAWLRELSRRGCAWARCPITCAPLPTLGAFYGRAGRSDETLAQSALYHFKCLAVPREPLVALTAMMLPPTSQGDVVLRNLSKRVFVPQASLDALNARLPPRSDRAFVFTLGHAVLARICPATATAAGMADPGHTFTAGAWAGDRLDIVPGAVFRAKATPQWKDASEDVGETLRLLWMAEVGE